MSDTSFNSNRQVKVDNASDYGGNLAETFGVDLRKANPVDALSGDFAVGAKQYAHTSDANVAGVGLVQQFAFSDCDSLGTFPNPTVTNYFAGSNTGVLYTPALSTRFAKDVSSNNPSSASPNGELTVFGKSYGFYSPVSVTGTVTTPGTGLSNQLLGDFTGALRDAVITITGAGAAKKGVGRLYTSENGGSILITIADGSTAQLDVGTVIQGTNPANPTAAFSVTVATIVSPTQFTITPPSIDIPYGVLAWTVTLASTTQTTNAEGVGTSGGIQLYATGAVDLSSGGPYTASYKNIGSLVDQLIAGTATDLWKKTQGVWTPNWWTAANTDATGNSGLGQAPFTSPPLLAFLPSLGRLYIVDGIHIHYIQSQFGYQTVHAFRNQMSAGMVPTWVVNDDFNVYIGAMDSTTGQSGVWVYQPLVTVNDNGDIRFYDMDAEQQGPGTGFIYENGLYIVHPDGSIKPFTGNGFKTVAYTPGFKKNVPFPVARHGIITQGSDFFLLTKGDIAFPSGIYKFDLDSGNFYHYAAMCTRPTVAGQPAMAGEMVLEQAGGLYLDRAGGIFSGVEAFDIPSGGTEFDLILNSVNYFSVPAAQTARIFSAKMVFADVRKALTKLWVKYQMYSGESIAVAYRTQMLQGGPATLTTVTWTGTTSFTTAAAGLPAIEVGDQVTIMRGSGSGLVAYILAITGTTTKTVTLDTAIGRASGTGYVFFKKFRKAKDITLTTLQRDDMTLPFVANPAEWVQLELSMTGVTASIKDFRLTDNENIK